MEQDLVALLSQASLGMIVLALVLVGLGLPIPEEVLLLGAGALCRSGPVPLVLVIPICAAGVTAGDLLLFTSARRLGTAAFEKPLFWRLLPERRRAKLERLFARYGLVLVFVARHLAGLRAPVFALAGINGMPLKRFLLWDMLGMCISVPLMVGLGYVFSDHLRELGTGVRRAEHWVVGSAIVGLLAYLFIVAVQRIRGDRRS